MKEFEIGVFVSVFYEMMGPALWVMVALSLAIVVAFIWLVWRRGLASGRLVKSEAIGVLGGIAAVLALQMITSSSFRDVGGPIDVILLLLIWLAGAIGTTLLAYVLLTLLAPGSTQTSTTARS